MINRSLQLPPPYHPRQQQLQRADPPKYCLAVRQQPRKARLCSFKDKVDRRPLDPPPIVQLFQSSTMSFNDYHNSANFFLHTTLANASDHSDIHVANGNRTTAGSVVQSLHKLKDTDEAEGAFFIFADISIRIEGIFRLKFTLFEIKGMEVERVCSIYSDPFQVYSPKSFPGMSESTALTRSFSDQGVRIRIRKEARAVTTTPSMKRRRGMDQHEPELYSSSSASTTPKEETHYTGGSSSPINTSSTTVNNAMSMQNLLIAEPPTTTYSPMHESLLFSNRTILPLPQPPPPQHHRRSLTPPLAIQSLISSEQVETNSAQGHYYYSASSNIDQQQQRLPSLLRPSASDSTSTDTYHHHYHHPRYKNEWRPENSSS